MKLPLRLRELSHRDSRALFYGGLIVGALVLWNAGLAPFLATVEERRAELTRERTLLTDERTLLQEIERDSAVHRQTAAHARELRTRLFRPPSAAATVTEYVVARADNAHVHLARTEPSNDPRARSSAGIKPVSVRIWGETDLRGLIDFVTSLERGEKLLDIRELRIEGSRRSSREFPWESLSFELQITGYTDDEDLRRQS